MFKNLTITLLLAIYCLGSTTSLRADEEIPKWLGHYRRGEYLESKGKYNEAMVEIKKAIKYQPKYAFLHYKLSVIYYSKKILNKALEEIKKAIALEPRNAFYHYTIAYMYRDMDMPEKSIEEVKIAINIRPKDREISAFYSLLATFYYQKKMYDDAIRAAKEAINNTTSEAYKHGYREDIKRYKKAKEMLRIWGEYPLEASIKVAKAKYVVGEPIDIVFTLKNLGDKNIYINTYDILSYIDLSIYGPDGKKLKPIFADVSRKMRLLTKQDFALLHYNKSFSVTINNLKTTFFYHELKTPGEYTITVFYRNMAGGENFDLKNVWMGSIDSNTITIDIIEPGKQ